MAYWFFESLEGFKQKQYIYIYIYRTLSWWLKKCNAVSGWGIFRGWWKGSNYEWIVTSIISNLNIPFLIWFTPFQRFQYYTMVSHQVEKPHKKLAGTNFIACGIVKDNHSINVRAFSNILKISMRAYNLMVNNVVRSQYIFVENNI